MLYDAFIEESAGMNLKPSEISFFGKDIEEVYKTSKLKRYSNCKTILHEKDGLTGKKTFCDDIEWKTINTGVEHYRVTYELYGKTFSILEKHRPVGRNKRMKVTVTPLR